MYMYIHIYMNMLLRYAVIEHTISFLTIHATASAGVASIRPLQCDVVHSSHEHVVQAGSVASSPVRVIQ